MRNETMRPYFTAYRGAAGSQPLSRDIPVVEFSANLPKVLTNISTQYRLATLWGYAKKGGVPLTIRDESHQCVIASTVVNLAVAGYHVNSICAVCGC